LQDIEKTTFTLAVYENNQHRNRNRNRNRNQPSSQKPAVGLCAA
jgi:hypothetical protein